MLALAKKADETATWDSIWVGDSIFAKPRLDALVLLGSLSAITRRVKLGPACFASTPLRNALLLAYQWASLDYLSNGRTIFVACQGAPGPGGGLFTQEFAAFQVDPASRMRRMEEAIEVLRLTSSHEKATYHGQYNQFEGVTVLPRPVQQPIPIWVTANPDPWDPQNPDPVKVQRADRALRRVARYGDGWMTTLNTPDSFSSHLNMIRQFAIEEARELGPEFEACLYYNINVNENREAALSESKRFLDSYYDVDYPRSILERWVACGSPQECIESLRDFMRAGATTITLRLSSYDQGHQFDRVTGEVLPALLNISPGHDITEANVNHRVAKG
jgi:alkanesulfonate monooxygenase SsuD/methylene tetrahydromethanopterin reductase-like flavin-dependent oxidoreductase (luciferase family)